MLRPLSSDLFLGVVSSGEKVTDKRHNYSLQIHKMAATRASKLLLLSAADSITATLSNYRGGFGEVL